MAAMPSAQAASLWNQNGRSITSVNYWQGITFDAMTRTFYFDGPANGIWRTDASLRRLAGRATGIPSDVTVAEGWNHLGDLSFDRGSGGRLLVPLECYYPGAPDPNTCKTGGIGVIDPVSLQWRYHVKLNPAEITKAMWVEVSPDGRWVWTSSGTDLLAYDATAIVAPQTGHSGAPLSAAKRIAGVLRAPNVSGATFFAGRLYLAYDRGSYVQVLSYPVDPNTGDVATTWRLELQRTKSPLHYETEGLATADALGGLLHWQIQPQVPLRSGIVHYTHARSAHTESGRQTHR
ncbi:MAG: hypothetical protein V7607_2614 [Solirubrobacteraceae bacterium]